jgi:hypothetical protein
MTRAAAKKYRQAKGVECREIGGDLFLIHAAANAIHHVDPIGGAIWRQLAKPITPADIRTLLATAYPDVPREHIADSLRRLLKALKAWDLIREAPASLPRKAPPPAKR